MTLVRLSSSWGNRSTFIAIIALLLSTPSLAQTTPQQHKCICICASPEVGDAVPNRQLFQNVDSEIVLANRVDTSSIDTCTCGCPTLLTEPVFMRNVFFSSVPSSAPSDVPSLAPSSTPSSVPTAQPSQSPTILENAATTTTQQLFNAVILSGPSGLTDSEENKDEAMNVLTQAYDAFLQDVITDYLDNNSRRNRKRSLNASLRLQQQQHRSLAIQGMLSGSAQVYEIIEDPTCGGGGGSSSSSCYTTYGNFQLVLTNDESPAGAADLVATMEAAIQRAFTDDFVAALQQAAQDSGSSLMASLQYQGLPQLIVPPAESNAEESSSPTLSPTSSPVAEELNTASTLLDHDNGGEENRNNNDDDDDDKSKVLAALLTIVIMAVILTTVLCCRRCSNPHRRGRPSAVLCRTNHYPEEEIVLHDVRAAMPPAQVFNNYSDVRNHVIHEGEEEEEEEGLNNNDRGSGRSNARTERRSTSSDSRIEEEKEEEVGG